jgi:uroporphyrinogen-III synthase
MPAAEPLPLAGIRVVVTRAEHQAAGLAAALGAAGAAVAHLPLLEVTPPADPAPLARARATLPLYDWVVLTSANAVAALLPAGSPAQGDGRPAPAPGDSQPALPREDGQPAPAPGDDQPALPRGDGLPAPRGALPPRLRIAAVGAATAAALRGQGIEPTLVAAGEEQSAGGLLAALLARLSCGQRVLLPQAADALPTLRDGLLAAGVAAVAVPAYDKRRPADAAARADGLFTGHPIGWVTFTSPSIVRAFSGLFAATWEDRRGELRAASIGAVTSVELRRQGVEPAAVAAEPGDQALAAAIIAAATAAGS